MKNQKCHVLAYNWQPKNRREIETALAKTSRITFEHDPAAFRMKLGMEKYDVIILEVEPDNGATFDMLHFIQETLPNTPVIVTHHDESQAQLIAEAIHHGAYDCIVGRCLPERIRCSLAKAVDGSSRSNELAYLRRTQDVVYSFDDVVAETPCFRKIVGDLRKFAAFDSTMLFSGELGTGKSFLAGAVHFNSPRKDRPFIKIKCTNMPEQMLESELFGHEVGAFPGADKPRVGRLEQADGGTVYLNEIGDFSKEMQAKLLRLLEEKSFERLGGNRTIFVDVRIIAATNRDLTSRIADGRFREDLYYRLNVLPVRLPPLSERPDCIAPLANKLLARMSANMCKSMSGFTDQAMHLLIAYHWPGNILQLANVIERAVILEEGDLITPASLQGPGDLTSPVRVSADGIPELVDSECALILRALQESNWVQKDAALKLGISPRVMNYKIQKHQIAYPGWRRRKKRGLPKL